MAEGVTDPVETVLIAQLGIIWKPCAALVSGALVSASVFLSCSATSLVSIGVHTFRTEGSGLVSRAFCIEKAETRPRAHYGGPSPFGSITSEVFAIASDHFVA